MLIEIADYFDSTIKPTPCAKGHTRQIDCSIDLANRYLTGFTGAAFDPRIDGSEPWWEDNKFNASDVFAVASLSMAHLLRPKILRALVAWFEKDALAAAACVSRSQCQEHVGCLLSQIPSHASIRDASAAQYIELANLAWNLMADSKTGIRAIDWVGDVSVNKLMSRKRPGLLCVVDECTRIRVNQRRKALGESKKCVDYWIELHGEMASASPSAQVQINSGLSMVRAQPSTPVWITDLRIIDVLIWMSQMSSC